MGLGAKCLYGQKYKASDAVTLVRTASQILPSIGENAKGEGEL